MLIELVASFTGGDLKTALSSLMGSQPPTTATIFVLHHIIFHFSKS